MNKVLYVDNDKEYNLKENEFLEVYHFVIDKSVDVKINLNGEYAKVIYHLNIISSSDNNCKIDVRHLANNTQSTIICHGINLQDNNLDFDITTLVPQDIFKCVCNEENIIINLSNGKSTIKPNLLIRNFDAIANHSAYIGKFDDNKRFYLESRGISKNKATIMLVESLLIDGCNKDEKIVKQFLKYLREINYG